MRNNIYAVLDVVSDEDEFVRGLSTLLSIKNTDYKF